MGRKYRAGISRRKKQSINLYTQPRNEIFGVFLFKKHSQTFYDPNVNKFISSSHCYKLRKSVCALYTINSAQQKPFCVTPEYFFNIVVCALCTTYVFMLCALCLDFSEKNDIMKSQIKGKEPILCHIAKSVTIFSKRLKKKRASPGRSLLR